MSISIRNWYNSNKQPFIFVIKMVSVYLIMQLFYDYYLSPYTKVDSILINSIIAYSQKLLLFLNYELLVPDPAYQYHMGIYDTSGVVIGNPCDGLSLFILFTAFLIVFKGNYLFKIVYLLLGIFLIHLLNIIRVTGLALIVKYSPQSLDFHHSYTFTLFVYLFIFILWVLRIKIFKKKKW